jgi:hypothetical protein
MSFAIDTLCLVPHGARRCREVESHGYAQIQAANVSKVGHRKPTETLSLGRAKPYRRQIVMASMGRRGRGGIVCKSPPREAKNLSKDFRYSKKTPADMEFALIIAKNMERRGSLAFSLETPDIQGSDVELAARVNGWTSPTVLAMIEDRIDSLSTYELLSVCLVISGRHEYTVPPSSVVVVRLLAYIFARVNICTIGVG